MTTIGLAFLGDSRNPGDWSGTPYGIATGLETLGCRVVHLTSELPRPLARVAYRVAKPQGLATWRSAAMAVRLRRAGPLDGIVKIGSDHELRSTAPVATFEDMTVLQAQAIGEPYVTELPGRLIRGWVDRQRRAYRAASACCVASRWAADSLVRDYAVPERKVHVVGCGRNRDPGTGERDWSRPRFLFVGREWERKNGPAVLEAFVRLHAERPDARLDVVGGHPPLGAPGVGGHGFLRLGVPAERERLDGLYRDATCFVMPSRYEPFGIVYAEAGAAGLPSIGTTVGAAAEITGSDGGVVVDPGDGDALLTAMRALSDGDTAARMGAAAAARADHFTWPAVGARILGALGLPSLGAVPADTEAIA